MPFEFKLPDIGEGVVEGEIIRWLISPGDQVKEDQAMVEVMTDKATVEIPSPVGGTVLEIHGREGEIIDVGATMVVIETDAAPPTPATAKTVAPKAEKPRPTKGRRAQHSKASAQVLATPAIRRLAREKGIDLGAIRGTGPGGRITREDVQKPQPLKAREIPTAPTEKKAAGSMEPETLPYRGLRKRIGDHLVAAKRFAPHYTFVEEVDVTELAAVRRKFDEIHPGSPLTYLPFLIKAVIAGLKKFPLLNATLDEEKQLILLKREYNIGIATATEQGLVVPVVKHADRKSMLELAREISTLSERTRQGKVKLEELRDGTFTITSLGPLGGVMATPILNYPEVAILGVHRFIRKPVVVAGEIVIRDRVNLSLSLDHRVVDGMVGAQFMQSVIPYLENPGLLAID